MQTPDTKIIIFIGIGIVCLILIIVFAVLAARKNKDGKKEPLNDRISFDPDTQYAVIKSSICTGEKVAGFKNKKDGHFVEVMVIRTSEDERRFKEMYGLESVRTEY